MGNTAGLSFFVAGAQTAALAVAGTMVTNVGNHIAFGDPLMSGKDLLITAGVSFVTGGLFRAPRVPVSTVSEFTPAGMVGIQAESTISATAGPTTIANIASETALDASTELAKAGITTVKNLEGQFSFTAVNQLDDVVVTAGKSSGNLWSSTKALSSVGNAFAHFKKHALEFPEFNNAVQYVKGAKYFMNNEIEGQLTKIRPNGDFLKYHPQTNTFGITNSMGEVKTMFRPEKGMEYWLSLK